MVRNFIPCPSTTNLAPPPQIWVEPDLMQDAGAAASFRRVLGADFLGQMAKQLADHHGMSLPLQATGDGHLVIAPHNDRKASDNEQSIGTLTYPDLLTQTESSGGTLTLTGFLREVSQQLRLGQRSLNFNLSGDIQAGMVLESLAPLEDKGWKLQFASSRLSQLTDLQRESGARKHPLRLALITTGPLTSGVVEKARTELGEALTGFLPSLGSLLQGDAAALQMASASNLPLLVWSPDPVREAGPWLRALGLRQSSRARVDFLTPQPLLLRGQLRELAASPPPPLLRPRSASVFPLPGPR